jgi:hypothetical protein
MPRSDRCHRLRYGTNLFMGVEVTVAQQLSLPAWN